MEELLLIKLHIGLVEMPIITIREHMFMQTLEVLVLKMEFFGLILMDFYVEVLIMVLPGKYMKDSQFVKIIVLELVNLITKEQYLVLKTMAQV